MRVLVTGATGLVGNNVVRLLLQRGQSVRVLVREGADERPLQGLDVERCQGDVRDAESVYRACRGVEGVVHAAGWVKIGWSDQTLHSQINIEGARHVAEACRELGTRLVHVSTINSLGYGHHRLPANEEQTTGQNLPCPYVATKRAADGMIDDQVSQGLDAVTVHPGFMLGPWDWKPSSGRMLLEVATRFTPFAPPGGCSVCDVRDVAAAIVTALRQGQTGRRYVLGGHNLSYLETWRIFGRVTRGGGPVCRLGPLARILTGCGGDLWGRISGREPDLNSAAMWLSARLHYFSSQRAVDELAYRIRPFEDSVRSAWEWFLSHDYVEVGRRRPRLVAA